MDNLNLKDYLFRVYTKFKIVNPALDEAITTIEKCDLTSLVRLLVYGRISNDTKPNPILIKDDFLGLLYDTYGKSSALALSLLKGENLYQVDLGYLLDNNSYNSGTEYKVSLSTFILILLFYSSIDYINIGHNMKTAIERFLSYVKNSYLLNRFPEIEQDRPTLEELLRKVKINEVKPSRFREFIEKIGKQLEERVQPFRSENGDNEFIMFWESLASNVNEPISLEDLMNAMFELFKAGYYPASISSVLPDTILATIPGKDVSGQLDYLLLLDNEDCPTASNEDVKSEDNLVRVVFLGSYGGDSLLFEHESRWRSIEERLPGVWKLFRIIYKRLKEGEYNTAQYRFSDYKFAIKGDDENILKAAKVRWLSLFSSFILGHVINLITTGSNQQVYKVAAPVINTRDFDVYLVPENFYDLQTPIIYYEVVGDTIKPQYYKHTWYKYQGDSVYTPTSSSVSDTASYNSSYAIVINTDLVTDVTLKSYGGNINDWNEVVEGEIESQKGLGGDSTIVGLSFKLYGDDGAPVKIRLKASSPESGQYIEPNKVNLEEDTNTESQE